MAHSKPHTFHIPVMGLAYTVDSPIRVAQYGISSVISIVDDELLEKMNRFYSQMYNLPFHEIGQKMRDYRAQRITNYLNTVEEIVRRKCEAFKAELAESLPSLERFAAMLPTTSELRQQLDYILSGDFIDKPSLKSLLDRLLQPGAIDVNIMTKVDKDNFDKNQKLPVEFNDAHAALRGFANSRLQSSVVLSAGMNPRLYSYFENFADFFPSSGGTLAKKIILKVSDFRSAMIQGNFLAKKGLWVSEYRIESGLNCGGHAFATDGLLLGPILEEFKQKKQELVKNAFDWVAKAWAAKGIQVPDHPPTLSITVQGGVGTAAEHALLLSRYGVDSVGWGSPFLLVPEATCTDADTRQLLASAGRQDFYLSQMSPLGVAFNTVKGTTNAHYLHSRIASGKPGSSCPKKLLALHADEDRKGVCTASQKYQQARLEELAADPTLDPIEKTRRAAAITEKACLCVGLANAAYLENGLPIKGQPQGVVVCPGPNLAYFDREISLYDMVRHIYGGPSVLAKKERPHLFVNELQLYVDYWLKAWPSIAEPTAADVRKWENFRKNLLDGIDYYRELLAEDYFGESQKIEIATQLEDAAQQLHAICVGALQPENC